MYPYAACLVSGRLCLFTESPGEAQSKAIVVRYTTDPVAEIQSLGDLNSVLNSTSRFVAGILLDIYEHNPRGTIQKINVIA